MPELHQLERRKDWPVIVGAVKCPTCQAAEGERCTSLGRREFRSLMQPSPRSDWHQTRKNLAAKEFNKNLERRDDIPLEPMGRNSDGLLATQVPVNESSRQLGSSDFTAETQRETEANHTAESPAQNAVPASDRGADAVVLNSDESNE